MVKFPGGVTEVSRGDGNTDEVGERAGKEAQEPLIPFPCVLQA